MSETEPKAGRSVVKTLAAVGCGLVLLAGTCVGGFFVFLWFWRQPPEDVQPLVDRYAEDVDEYARTTRTRCPEIQNQGWAALLGGGTASPASRTMMASWPELLQLETGCIWWNDETHTSGAGNDFAKLTEWSPPDGSYDGSSRLDGVPWGSTIGYDDVAVLWRAEFVLIEVERPFEDDSGYIQVRAYFRR